MCYGRTGIFSEADFSLDLTSLDMISGNGEVLWTSFLRATRAKGFQPRPVVGPPTPTCGPRFCRWWRALSLDLYSSKMLTKRPGPWCDKTWNDEATELGWVSFARGITERRITGNAPSYLPTPTATCNQWAPSMQKHPACRRLVSLSPTPTETLLEWMMGLPEGWTDGECSEKAWSQWWQVMRSGILWNG